MPEIPNHQTLDDVLAAVGAAGRDALARVGLMALATIGQDRDWYPGLAEEVAWALKEHKPEGLPDHIEPSTAEENYWRRFTGADPIGTTEGADDA